jgi:aryl-alcohol dehydrogenase-like predicted oxidoreductase
MKYKILGKTNYTISELGFGAWAIGGSWGEVNDYESLAALEKAIELGVNFIDTADVYGDGQSEKLVSKLVNSKKEKIFVATKFGRRSDPHTIESYNEKNLENYLDQSLENLGVDTIDLIQLHCPPTEVYYRPEVFAAMEKFRQKGKIRNYGVSVEKVEEGIKALEYPGVASVQIIFNIFRQRPREKFFELAEQNNVGIIARVPLASGLLTGKFSKDSEFSEDDHRNFNREGEAFDRGETFAGIPFETGVEVSREVEGIRKEYTSRHDLELTNAQFALKWILDHPQISCTIPGCKTPDQAQENFSANDDGYPIDLEAENQLKKLYQEKVKKHVHQKW